jgi:hypothetical protein
LPRTNLRSAPAMIEGRKELRKRLNGIEVDIFTVGALSIRIGGGVGNLERTEFGQI